MEKRNFFKNWKDIPTTSRGMTEYLSDLDLTPEEIAGKKILDIGAGIRKFAKGAEDRGIKADIYSLDPMYSVLQKKSFAQCGNDNLVKRFKKNESFSIKEKTVAALEENLPFKDNFFDMVVSEYCMPLYAFVEEQIERFLLEVIRVLKNKGQARLFPFYNINDERLFRFSDSLVKKLAQDKKIRIMKKENNLLVFEKTETVGENKDI